MWTNGDCVQCGAKQVEGAFAYDEHGTPFYCALCWERYNEEEGNQIPIDDSSAQRDDDGRQSPSSPTGGSPISKSPARSPRLGMDIPVNMSSFDANVGLRPSPKSLAGSWIDRGKSDQKSKNKKKKKQGEKTNRLNTRASLHPTPTQVGFHVKENEATQDSIHQTTEINKNTSPPVVEDANVGIVQHESVRPPKWEGSTIGFNGRTSLDHYKQKQLQNLTHWRSNEREKSWDLHHDHFDWWMFPIDDGSRPEFNMYCEEDVLELGSDQEWLLGYRDAVRLAAKAWGWDVYNRKRIYGEDGMGWTDWDVRLAKIVRSLWLFGEQDLFESMQAYAWELKKNEKQGRPFTYGRHVLDEILYMRLPRSGCLRTFTKPITEDEKEPADEDNRKDNMEDEKPVTTEDEKEPAKEDKEDSIPMLEAPAIEPELEEKAQPIVTEEENEKDNVEDEKSVTSTDQKKKLEEEVEPTKVDSLTIGAGLSGLEEQEEVVSTEPKAINTESINRDIETKSKWEDDTESNSGLQPDLRTILVATTCIVLGIYIIRKLR